MPSSGSAVMRPSAGPVARARPLPLRYPHLSLTLLLWLLGLWVAFLAKPPAVNDEQAAAFKAKLQEVRAAGRLRCRSCCTAF